MDTLGRQGVREAAPAGGQQDEDGVEVSPALGGGVQLSAALQHHAVRGKRLRVTIMTVLNLRYPGLYIADDLTAPVLCIKYQIRR